MSDNRTIPELSVDSQVLIKRFKQMAKGDFVPYGELNDLIGCDVQGKSRDTLSRARHRVLRDDKVVIECVHGKGVKRIEDADCIGIGEDATKRVRRLTRKATEKMLGGCDYPSLSNDNKLQYNTHLSIMGALATITTASKVKAIAAAVEKAQDKLPLAKTLEAFKA